MSSVGKSEYKPGNRVAYGVGALAENASYQAFTFLVFTFYYAVIGIDINLVTLGFVIWSVWNAFNDPVIGLVSDRTKTKYGRRIPYIAAGSLPLALIMYFLWTPPLGPPELSFLYFLVAIILFDFFYTMLALNLTALFPEMWLTEKERNAANNFRQMLIVVGLLIAFVVPTILIPDMSARSTPASQVILDYQFTGILLAVIVCIGMLITLKWGVQERREFSDDSLSVPSFVDALRHTLRNKNFHWFLIMNTCIWYVFGLIPTIIPLYGQFVLNTSLGGILLAGSFITGILFVNLWKWVVDKIGDLRKALIMSMGIWIITLMPLAITVDFTIAMILFAINGLGLAGALLLRDLVIADIVDEDEIRTGVRREGSFFGVNALIMRFAVILVFVSINLVLNNVGWTVFEPSVVTESTLLGLRLLVGVFPSAALLIGALAFSRYPLVGGKLKEMKEKRDRLHADKQSQAGKYM
ncbi:MAG: MFS transporter [Candidatus Thorarchaeota archaeon]|nr:MAG: MFS transporter [Candidatus Thorarchaeota archaeon]